MPKWVVFHSEWEPFPRASFRHTFALSPHVPSQPFGVSYSGATYKYTVLDTNGKRAAAAGKFPMRRCLSLCLTFYLSGTATSNSLSIPLDSILLHWSWTHKQLHRKLLRGFDKTPRRAFHQYGRCHSEFESPYRSSIRRLAKNRLEEGVVSETRRVDPSRDAHGRNRDSALGVDCARTTPEREGTLPLPPVTLDGSEPNYRERTNEKEERFLTTSISTRYRTCYSRPHV